jgi:hypothetical protein
MFYITTFFYTAGYLINSPMATMVHVRNDGNSSSTLMIFNALRLYLCFYHVMFHQSDSAAMILFLTDFSCIIRKNTGLYSSSTFNITLKQLTLFREILQKIYI